MDEPFILNVAAAPAVSRPHQATRIGFEPDGLPWPDTGVNIQIMEPGQPNCRYHSEPVQEDFLVLHGECVVILDGEERPLRQWDFVHCPAGADHIIVGAGERRCVVLAVGARTNSTSGNRGGYRVDEVALRLGAGVERETTDVHEAYAAFADPRPARYREGSLPRT